MTPGSSTSMADWLQELEQLTARAGSASFHDELLSVAVRRLGGSGGVIWRTSADEQLEVTAQHGMGDKPIDRIHHDWNGHEPLLRQVLRSGRPQAISARLDQSLGDGETAGATSTPLQLLVAPVYVCDDEPDGVIEIFVADSTDESAAATALQTLDGFCRAAAARVIVRRGPGERAVSPETIGFAQLCCRIHESLDLVATAESIVNAVRLWTECSRVSVLERRGGRFRLLAVSDLDGFDRRSDAVRSVEHAAGVVARNGRPIWKDGHSQTSVDPAAALPAELDAPDWMVGAIPLTRAGDPDTQMVGMLWVEDFDVEMAWTGDGRNRLELAAVQAGCAVANAVEHRQLPLHGLGRGLRTLGWGAVRSSTPKWLVAGVCLAGLVAALTFIQTDFDITGHGTLRPLTQRDVFARIGGIVEEPVVKHGDPVQVGVDVLKLWSPDLNRERAELDGQIRTTEQQIADLALLRADSDSGGDRNTQIELAARQAELSSVLENLQGQEAALSQYEQQLTLTSPVSGTVLTWDVEQLLEGRYVHPGQRLLTVADIEGPWIVEIRVPDRDIDHVLSATDDDPAMVTFVTATDLDSQHSGVVVDVARAIEYHPIDGPVVLVTVAVANEEAIQRQPGSSVYPRIHCGRRSLGYVWFRRLYEATASWVAL